MKKPKIGDLVKVHLRYAGTKADRVLQKYDGKVVPVKDYGYVNGHIDIDRLSQNFLTEEDYSIIDFGDYLKEIERDNVHSHQG